MMSEKGMTPAASHARPATSQARRLAGLLAGLLLITLLPSLSTSRAVQSELALPGSANTLVKYATAAATPLLRCFQVYPPVLTPTTGNTEGFASGTAEDAAQASAQASCSVTETLMVHSFANSYGTPYVGPYAPPANCKFNRVTFNLTADVAGVQFDRLGEIYLNDTEIWRTSTAEPTRTGIVWTYIKDMSHFYALLSKPQTLIFELDNNVDSTYTGIINVTLQATFFNQPDNTVQPADAILPISARLGSTGHGSAWDVPPSNATSSITLPRNVNRAVVGIAATGQIYEEFWYTNVFTSQVDTFPGDTLYGYSPFREVQLFIDGTLAGVVWPFPIIFTGGIVPGFWRPEVGIDAFDLREDEIDITPWLGLLCDGKSHTFAIKIAGINDNNGQNPGTLTESVGSFWIVSGQIFMWLDPEGSVTTGPAPTINAPPPAISISSTLTKLANGTNETLAYNTHVQRQLSIKSNIKTANGSVPASWTQSLTYGNYGLLTDQGITQYNQQNTTGSDVAQARPYARQISYPITVNSTYTQNPVSISALVDRTQDISIAGDPVFPTGLQSFNEMNGTGNGPKFQGSQLQTRQNGTATYLVGANGSTSSGTTEQVLEFRGLSVDSFGPGFPGVTGSEELYQRHVLASNDSVVYDEQSLIGRPIGGGESQAPQAAAQGGFAKQSVLQALGRGSGPRYGMPGSG